MDDLNRPSVNYRYYSVYSNTAISNTLIVANHGFILIIYSSIMNMWTYFHTLTHTQAHTHARTHARTHTHTHTHMHTRTHAHTRTHTHKHTHTYYYLKALRMVALLR